MNLKEVIKQRGYTQVQLAEKVGISQASLSDIINGVLKPKESTLQRIADELGIDVADLRASGKMVCSRCGSEVVLEWYNHSTGACRLRCGFCDLDTGEQKSRTKALHVFQSYLSASQSSSAELHVLSLQELLDSGSFDAEDTKPVWFENRGLFVVPSILQCGVAEREQDLVRVFWSNSFGWKSFNLSQYNSWWRVWSGKPTDSQMEAIAWQD